MDWIQNFDFFLFDFDGLLVDTEKLHYEAYQLLCRKHRITLDWSFEHFCSVGHISASALRETLYLEFPSLYAEEPDWDVLYTEKKEIYLQLLEYKPVDLMPGAKELLEALEKANKRRVVVTHSPREQVDLIKKQQPLLGTIPYWVTRENYTHPKPSPDAYLTAIRLYGLPGDQMIGFEDSARGLSSLKATPALAVHITKTPTGHTPTFPTLAAVCFS